MTVVLFTTATAPITCVKADSLELIFGSKHYVQGEFNESNPGIGYNSDKGYAVGVYKNSYSNTSVYLGRVIEKHWKYVSLGAVIGVTTGYEEQSGHIVLPMGQTYILAGPKFAQAKLGVMPGAFTFALRIPL